MSDEPLDPFTGEQPRARTATARVTGMNQEIVITLTGIPRLSVEMVQLGPGAYPPAEPYEIMPDLPDEADVPLHGAEGHPIRRQLPMLLDRALGAILHPRGPAESVILDVEPDGRTRLTVLPHAPRAARALGLPDWIQALRVINLWYRNGWYITAQSDRKWGKGLEVGDIEREVSSLAMHNGTDIVDLLNAVIAQHAVNALNCILRVPQDEP